MHSTCTSASSKILLTNSICMLGKLVKEINVSKLLEVSKFIHELVCIKKKFSAVKYKKTFPEKSVIYSIRIEDKVCFQN